MENANTMTVPVESKRCQKRVIKKQKKTEQNAVDKLVSAIGDIQQKCHHVPGDLVEDVILEPSKKEGVFLAENEKGRRRTFLVFCRDCNKRLRLIIGEFCPNCFTKMKKIDGPCEIKMFNRYDYLPDREGIGSFYSVIKKQCPDCNLEVVWDRFSYECDQ